MTTYTATQRADIASAFRAAKPFLWDGNGHHPGLGEGNDEVEVFICIAIFAAAMKNHISNNAYCLAKGVIDARLKGFFAVENWLKHRGIDASDAAEVQTYRHRWLDALIAEFSA